MQDKATKSNFLEKEGRLLNLIPRSSNTDAAGLQFGFRLQHKVIHLVTLSY